MNRSICFLFLFLIGIFTFPIKAQSNSSKLCQCEALGALDGVVLKLYDSLGRAQDLEFVRNAVWETGTVESGYQMAKWRCEVRKKYYQKKSLCF